MELTATRAELDATLAQSEGTRGELAAVRTELDATRADLTSARAELEAARTAVVQRADPPATGVSPDVLAELQARIAELEALRRDEVSELQRTQQALANTQYEMTEAARRAKQAEERLRELEGEAPVPRPLSGWPPRLGRSEPEVDEAPAPPEISAPPGWVADGSAAEADVEGEVPDEDVPERHVMPSKEGLSLRERLTRAAAARHRISPSAEEEGAER
jgi:hypothetical protein